MLYTPKMKPLLFFFVFLAIGVFLFPVSSDAAGLIPCGGCAADLDPVSGECPLGQEQPACQLCHVFVLLNNITTFLLVPSLPLNGGFALVPIIGALLLGLGGFIFLVSAGNPQRLAAGKRIILAVIIGFFIIYGSWLFISVFFASVGLATWAGLGTWWTITC